MAGQDMADRAARLERRIERIDRRARHAESAGDPLPLENENRGIDRAHPGHVRPPFDLTMAENAPRRGDFSIFSEIFFTYRRNSRLATDFAGFSVFQRNLYSTFRKTFLLSTMMEMTEKRRRGRPRAFNAPAEPNAVQSLDRALRILAIVADADGLSLSAKSPSGSGLAASTAYRMLTTLANHGMVEFAEPEQLWSVGVEAYRIGRGVPAGAASWSTARGRSCRSLMEKTGETANLGVAEDDCVVFVSQVETHQAIRAFFRPGTRSPFHASGIGKAILAHLGAGSRRRRSSRRTGLEAFTDKTLVAMPRACRRPRSESGRAAGRSTTRSAIPACAASRRRSSTNSASRSAASRSRARPCA